LRPALTEGVKKYHIPSQKLGFRTRNGSKGARKNLLSSGRHAAGDLLRRGGASSARAAAFGAVGVVVAECSGVVVWWVWVGWCWCSSVMVVVWWVWVGWCSSVVGSAAGAGAVVL